MAHRIRLATVDDSGTLLDIYAPYVANTVVSFELTVPTDEVFRQRVARLTATHPYLVYEIDGHIVGFAYAGRHAEREAYCYNVGVSVYVREVYHGRGIAARLYDCLCAILTEQGFYNVYARICVPNEKSERFHAKHGFVPVGTFCQTGYKLGAWRDCTDYVRTLRAHDDAPEPIKEIGALDADWLARVLTKATIKREDQA